MNPKSMKHTTQMIVHVRIGCGSSVFQFSITQGTILINNPGRPLSPTVVQLGAHIVLKKLDPIMETIYTDAVLSVPTDGSTLNPIIN